MPLATSVSPYLVLILILAAPSMASRKLSANVEAHVKVQAEADASAEADAVAEVDANAGGDTSTGNACQCDNCQPIGGWNAFQSNYAKWISTGHTQAANRGAAWAQCKATCTAQCTMQNGNMGQPFPQQQSMGVRIGSGGECLVAPPGGGWAMGNTDINACTTFVPTTLGAGMGKLQDPRSGLCFGWVHMDGGPAQFIVPGHQGPALAQCGITGQENRLDAQHTFHTIMKVSGNSVCIMSNAGEETSFCFMIG